MKKNTIFIILILIVFTACDSRTAEQYYNLANNAEVKGEYKKAIGLLDKAIEKKPKFRAALINRGADKSELKDYMGAIEDYKKILAFDYDNTLALMNIGNNYKRQHQYDSSTYYYTKAIETKGAVKCDGSFIEINFLGSVDYENWDKESFYYAGKCEILFERGEAYAKNNQFELAILDLKKVLKNDYEKGITFLWLGQSYLSINDTVNAKKHLMAAQNNGIIDAMELLTKTDKKN